MDKGEVVDAKTWCQFAQEQAGVDYYYKNSVMKVNIHYKKFREEYGAAAGWYEFAGVVSWAKAKNFQPSDVKGLAACWPYAVKDGFIEIRDLQGYDLDDMLYEAYAVETDEAWRRRLLAGVGSNNHDLYEEWKDYRRKDEQHA